MEKKLKPSAEKYFPLEEGKIVLHEDNNHIYVWDIVSRIKKEEAFLSVYGKREDGLYLEKKFNTGDYFFGPVLRQNSFEKDPLFYGTCTYENTSKDEGEGKFLDLTFHFKINEEGLKSVNGPFISDTLMLSEDFDKREPTPPSILDLKRHGEPWNF